MPGNVLAKAARTLVAATAVAVAGLASPANAAPPGFKQQCATPAKVVVKQIPWPQLRLVPERAWVLSRGGGVRVAVIDSGVDAKVPQLAGHVLPGIDLASGKGTADSDCVGHGTFVASIIAAQPTPGIGFAGIAPGATILPIRQTITGQDGSPAILAASIRAAADRGARVINISVGSPVSTGTLRSAVSYAQARDVLIVAAADGEGQLGDRPSYPAAYPGVLAVGAIDMEGKRSKSAENDPENGSPVALVAPGDGVLGLGTGGPGHLLGQGTSVAVPFVSGVAALVRSYRPRLSAPEVIRRLQLTADHTGGVQPDPEFGFGVVNPYAAMATVLAEEQPQASAVPQPGPLAVVYAAPADNGGRMVGLAIGALGLVVLLVMGALAVVLPRGRRRGWRPDAKTGDTKTGDTKASHTKASHAKTGDTKTSDTKASHTKASHTKIGDTKTGDTKASDKVPGGRVLSGTATGGRS